MIIIIRFGKNNVLVTIYINFGGVVEGVHGSSYIFWFIIVKSENLLEYDLY